MLRGLVEAIDSNTFTAAYVAAPAITGGKCKRTVNSSFYFQLADAEIYFSLRVLFSRLIILNTIDNGFYVLIGHSAFFKCQNLNGRNDS